MIEKIVSGGQTGVDRAALDSAIALDIPHGGWCPAGRRAEDGTIPGRYRLVEMDSPEYADRTRKNVEDSDGTLILNRKPPGRRHGCNPGLRQELRQTGAGRRSRQPARAG